MDRHNEKEAELARTLLIELMAYQFASPVEWIATQDMILGSEACERVIEIGPSGILKTMFRRTIDSLYQNQEFVLRSPRQLLTSEADTKRIYYEDEVIAQVSSEVVTPSFKDTPVPGRSPESRLLEPKGGSSPIPAKRQVVKEIEDQAVKARDVLVAIVSRALKKGDLELTKSIKSLAGGRSTLENEIIGDLNSEFQNLPDRAEDIPIQELANVMQSSFRGRLGKISTSIINTMFGTKMPGGFTVAAARRYLSTQWRFEMGRQDCCLLLSATMQPISRLGSELDATKFLDSMVEKHLDNEGLSIEALSATNDSLPISASISVETIKAITGHQKALSRKLFDAYAADLQLDIDASEQSRDDFRNELKTRIQDQLDMWEAEHGETYAKGIHPLFELRKVRTYDSSWSWALQDLLDVYHTISRQGYLSVSTLHSDFLSEKCTHIANAADEFLLQVLDSINLEYKDMTDLGAFFRTLKNNCEISIQRGPLVKGTPTQMAPYTVIGDEGRPSYHEQERKEYSRFSHLTMMASRLIYNPQFSLSLHTVPHIHLRDKGQNGWAYSPNLTTTLREVFDSVEKQGETLRDRTIMVTGAGIGSIGAAMVALFLSAGAKVLVTTSSFSPQVAKNYQEIYMQHGARGSQLVVAPFNQASVQDITSLVDYIYDELGWDIDCIVPFAAISENGRKLDTIDSKSELAHRLMLTNVLRLLGSVKSHKYNNKYFTRPTQVVLPLSPNHGTFGGDGLYGESKLALEALFNRWYSEDWRDFLCICGAVIGWTRGTQLMSQNDLVAEGIERLGVRTFSQDEMAHILVCLCMDSVYEMCQERPIYADLTGGMGSIENLPEKIHDLRQELSRRSEIQQALFKERQIELDYHIPSRPPAKANFRKLAHIQLDFPKSLDYDKAIAPLAQELHGMVDLQRVVVISGFAELGPHGNSRTRWEMEASGEFSLEGVIEMAWLMGMIRHYSGLVEGRPYSGWVDAKSGVPVADQDVKGCYEDQILAHSGIRFVEPELFDGYNPNRKQFLHEIVLEQDFGPIEVPETLAKEIHLEHGQHAVIKNIPDSDHCLVRLRKGARLLIPRAIQFSRTVAGQIPTGWDARTYGIPEDIIDQVDRVTLFTLVCAIEALLSSGITDPYELYQYIHVSEVGNCIGSGLGGNESLKKMYKDRYVGRDVQKDILQETFINTVSAWVNMLLLSASGPIRTPVGACATSIEALELGFDTIVTGKAKMCLVGGCDDFGEEISYEFANMGATSNSLEEIARGRSPSEMSRPTTSTRNGFVESHGCGIQILTSADLALKMGLPIRGIVAFVGTSSDKAGRSIPAPGQGVLTNARRITTGIASPLLNVFNRRKRLDLRLNQAKETRDMALDCLEEEISTVISQDPELGPEAYARERQKQILDDFAKDEREARFVLGNYFWRDDPSIAPLCGALATWGLTINDLDVASFHGTSTILNDKNESSVLQQQLTSLGRRKGKPAFGVFQKWLTGHSKGAAGAWMVNGALQILESGTVPGNRNADNIDPALKEYDHIAYINRPVQLENIKAISITSFGFGQKGAQAICVHPRYLFATLDRAQYEAYVERRNDRQGRANSYYSREMISNSLFKAKTSPPYLASEEAEAYLNPAARFPL